MGGGGREDHSPQGAAGRALRLSTYGSSSSAPVLCRPHPVPPDETLGCRGAVGARNWGACPLICDRGFVDRSGKCPLILGPTFDTVAAESRLLRAGSARARQRVGADSPPSARQQLRSARPPCRAPACGAVLPGMARWSPRGRSCLAPLAAVRACWFPSCCVCTFPARSLCEAKSSEKPRAGPPGGCMTLQPQPAAWEQQGEGGLAGRAGLGSGWERPVALLAPPTLPAAPAFPAQGMWVRGAPPPPTLQLPNWEALRRQIGLREPAGEGAAALDGPRHLVGRRREDRGPGPMGLRPHRLCPSPHPQV